jgi:hypothetical protein
MPDKAPTTNAPSPKSAPQQSPAITPKQNPSTPKPQPPQPQIVIKGNNPDSNPLKK